MSIFFLIFTLIMWPLGFFCLWSVATCSTKKHNTSLFAQTSIIIPARNEAENLPHLLESINRQNAAPAEVIVVDDSSEDNTPEIAEHWGARLVKAGPSPPGWYGKPWACHRGAKEAKGDILLFLDADTFFQDRGFSALASIFEENEGVVSVQPHHHVKRPYENLSAFFNIIVTAGLSGFTILGKNLSPAGAFGPCLMCRKKEYESIGLHISPTLQPTTIEEIFGSIGTGLKVFPSIH